MPPATAQYEASLSLATSQCRGWHSPLLRSSSSSHLLRERRSRRKVMRRVRDVICRGLLYLAGIIKKQEAAKLGGLARNSFNGSIRVPSCNCGHFRRHRVGKACLLERRQGRDIRRADAATATDRSLVAIAQALH